MTSIPLSGPPPTGAGGVTAILEAAIAQHAFPGASVLALHKQATVLEQHMGRFTYGSDPPAVNAGTVWDLASLTKVMVTTAMAMALHASGDLNLDQPLVELLPDFRGQDPRRARVSLRMLLAHSSGLPGYVRLFETNRDRDAMVKAVQAVPLTADPGSRAEYSDIGFILLGLALERLANQTLDRFTASRFFSPLGMINTGFCPPAEGKDRIPPTEDDRHFRRRILQGEVHDENAYALGGVAGHAG